MIALLILAATLSPSHDRPATVDPTGPGGRITAAALKDHARALSGLVDREAAAAYIESSLRSAGVAPAADVAPFLDEYRHRFAVSWAELDPDGGPANVVVLRRGGSASFEAIAIQSAPSSTSVEPTDQVFLVDPEDLEWLGAREGLGNAPSLPGGVVVAVLRGPESPAAASGALADQVRGAMRLGASALILVETSPTAYATPAPGPPPNLLMLRTGPDLASDLVGRQELARLAAPQLIQTEPGFRPILLDLMVGASGPYRRGQRPGVNLIGYLRGADPALRREAVLIASRYGTGDSSSEAATLLEMARVFADPAARPSRSLLLAALDGEEVDLAGSHALAARSAELGLTLAAVVKLGPAVLDDADPFRQAGLPAFECPLQSAGLREGRPADPGILEQAARLAVRTVWELAR